MPGRYTHVKPREQRSYPTYQYREMLRALGTNADVQEIIASYGFEYPTVAVIQGWRRRNSIPPIWLPLLLSHLMKDDTIRQPDQLLKAPL